jgi:hypothetical protein
MEVSKPLQAVDWVPPWIGLSGYSDPAAVHGRDLCRRRTPDQALDRSMTPKPSASPDQVKPGTIFRLEPEDEAFSPVGASRFVTGLDHLDHDVDFCSLANKLLVGNYYLGA